MRGEQKKLRSAVHRDQAESYLLTSLVSFGVTVILTRVSSVDRFSPDRQQRAAHRPRALGWAAVICGRVIAPGIRKSKGYPG